MDLPQVVDLVARNRAIIDEVELRHRRSVVAQLHEGRRLQVILGARGVGKSTALRQFAKLSLPPSQTALLSLDDLIFSADTLVDLGTALHDAGYRFLLLDEVHRYANWSREVKILYDRFPTYRITVTGSSITSLNRGDGDLSRRAARFTLRGMSWREWVAFAEGSTLPHPTLAELLTDAGDYVAEVRRQVASPVASYKAYLRDGYFPYRVEEPESAVYLQRVRAAAHLAIDLDIATTAELRPETTHKLKRLLSLIAGGSPYTPNMSTIAQQIGTERRQVYRLVEFMEEAHLVRRLWAAGQTPKTLAKPEKLYLENTNLSYALGNADVGNLRETAFLAAVSESHEVTASRHGDFRIGDTDFEVGGPSKTRKQLARAPKGYRVIDDVEVAGGDRVPLYLFGLLT